MKKDDLGPWRVTRDTADNEKRADHGATRFDQHCRHYGCWYGACPRAPPPRSATASVGPRGR